MNTKLQLSDPTPAPTPAQIDKSERKSKRFWVCIIFGFFAMDFTIAAIAISMAAGDPSFRSIPGYGERAVAWDIRRERKAASQKLGWQVTVQRAEPHRDAIDIWILDAEGRPVTGCTGTVQLFHFTRVAEQMRCELMELEPGWYQAKIDVSKPGRWHMDLELHASGHRDFWDERTLDWFEVPEKGEGTRG